MRTDYTCNFWVPLDVSKAIDPKTGEEIMRLGGIASTKDKDADGEFLDPKGFDFKYFMENGIVNWHHQATNSPGSIIGEPSKAEVNKNGFYIETDLYKSSPKAREVYDLAKTMQEDSDKRRLGFSIEGKAIERDKDNPKIVTKAKITGVAITHMPKNPNTYAEIIKGEGWEEKEYLEKGDLQKQVQQSTNEYLTKLISQMPEYEGYGEGTTEEEREEKGNDKKEKSLSTTSAAPLKKE